ncbi:hypothetical protein AMAG_20596 [Allomyces macrogynus ATCC 38327]|uniref:Uncharacterized protein n=1 Tax=Allomyces macrogynus (strain ATCC 38327) TaxID=578462 RepID=A0A0L0TE60_ALLM3|nr:hypothetical protein AMAG_20596 [Allomyces macrogynus ATCC 38327]|eukprot:KNE72879.1 hypothetical protein AMAG_20596 [Allomyces macrogynus ATCC 38327]
MNRSPVVAASSASARASTPPLRSALKSPARTSPVKTATFAGMAATDAAAIQLANADSTTITSLGIPGAQRPGSFEHDPHATDDEDEVPAAALAEDESDRAPSRMVPSAPPATGTAMRRHAAAAASVGGMAAPMGHDETRRSAWSVSCSSLRAG